MFNKAIATMLPWLPKSMVGSVAKRYISGDNIDSAITLAQSLADINYHTTIDWLGEDITTKEEAQQTAGLYRKLMDQMASRGTERNISLKLSQLGLRIDPELGFDRLTQVLETAKHLNFFVRLDMEDSTLTDATIKCYRRGLEIWPNIGTVLQSRLRRSVNDAIELSGKNSNIRLCKGIYNEPERIAYRDPGEINRSYLKIMEAIVDGGGYTGVATHDTNLIKSVRTEFADISGTKAGRLEFQALLGVPIKSTLEELKDSGETVRLYVPFGSDWYAYSLRRMHENPNMAGAVAKNLLRRSKLT